MSAISKQIPVKQITQTQSIPGQSMPSQPIQRQPLPTQPMQNQPIPSQPMTTDFPVNVTQTPGMPVFDPEFTQGYLRKNIGKKVKVEFLIGTNLFIDKEGTLIDVGIDYIILNPPESDDLVLCDLYSIKFVTFLL